MAYQKDNWDKPRSHGHHLEPVEIEQLRTAFRQGRAAADIARELKCSSRVAQKYYAEFRGCPKHQARRQNANIAKAAVICLVNNCDKAPEPGSRMCSDHAYQAPANVAKLTGRRA